MNNEYLIAGAVAVIALLAGVAIMLHWRLYKMRRAQAQASAEGEAQRAKQRNEINQSIQIIARALEARQVGATEASIRISVLMDALDVDQATKAEFSAFYKLAEEASHIPILDAWKALSKQERKAFDHELVALESKYDDFVLDASSRIQGRQF